MGSLRSEALIWSAIVRRDSIELLKSDEEVSEKLDGAMYVILIQYSRSRIHSCKPRSIRVQILRLAMLE